MLERGDFLKPAKAVEPGVPAFLNPMPAGAPATRLTFARWLVDRESPTTARSIVNRVWQADFGTGIVATSEDLGLQCEPPSPPRAARLAGRRVHGQRLEPQAPAPADRRLRRPIASRRG